MKYSDVVPNPDQIEDPLFMVNDYPPQRVAWDAANSIREFVESEAADSLPGRKLQTLLDAIIILRSEAEK